MSSILTLTPLLDQTSDIFARTGAAAQVAIGARGPASEAGIELGNLNDVNLWRNAANSIATDSTLYFKQVASAANIFLAADVAGDGANRFLLLADGSMQWGPGNAARDVTVIRGSVGRLDFGATTKGVRLHFPWGQLASDVAYSTQLEADTLNRFRIQYDGTLLWGAGSVTQPDASITRIGVGQLQLSPGPLSIPAGGGTAAFGSAFAVRGYGTAGDAQPQIALAVTSAGGLTFGVGGATATDMGLGRTTKGSPAVATLFLTTHVAVGNATTYGGAMPARGYVLIDNAADPNANPVNGGILYCVAGALKYRGTAGTTTTIALA